MLSDSERVGQVSSSSSSPPDTSLGGAKIKYSVEAGNSRKWIYMKRRHGMDAARAELARGNTRSMFAHENVRETIHKCPPVYLDTSLYGLGKAGSKLHAGRTAKSKEHQATNVKI
ncbi:hypothetical protein RRG08_062504 [Elysia crispata]|uniref:Uncharacterized protein n=1 Tax=Elysia crispata TaxID=231223 RepID=A0AAE0ZX76_9GAST|nr:hypothetical protein RRG08_062504 [Elysia crispata]